MERPKVTSLNDHITCGLCKGYLIEAVTITTCLHSFCHSCIIKHLSGHQEEDKLFCPTCLKLKVSDIVIITATDLRSDYLLQTIVYKIVPLLYEEEQKRRKHYKKNLTGHSEGDKKKKRNRNEMIGNFSSTFKIFCSFDVINVEISEMNSGRDGNNNSTDKKSDQSEVNMQKCRYLLCPVMLRVSHLKKFLLQKVYSGTDCTVILCTNGKPLHDDLCLADVCYIFGLQKATCVSIKYIAYILPESQRADITGLETKNRSNEVCVIAREGSAQLTEKVCEDICDKDPSDNIAPSFPYSEGDNNLICYSHELQLSSANDVSPTDSPAILTQSNVVSQANTNTVSFVNPSFKDVPLIVHDKTNSDSLREAQADKQISGDHMENEKCKTKMETIKHSPNDKTSNDNSLPLSCVAPLTSSASSPLTESSTAVPIIVEPNSEGLNADALVDSSSETTMASPPNSPLEPIINDSNTTRPCKVVLCRLPTTCFMGPDRKRKFSLDSDIDKGGNIPFNNKRKKLEEGQRKQTIHILMTKYKKGLRELIELKRTIQQMKHINTVRTSGKVHENNNTSLLNQEQTQVDQTNPNCDVSTESTTVTTCSSCPTLITSAVQADALKTHNSDIPSSIILGPIALPEATKSEMPNNQTIIPEELSNGKEDAKLSSIKSPEDLLSKNYQISSNDFSQASNQNPKPDFTSARSSLDVLGVPLSPNNDISWILKYAKACSQDKVGVKYPDTSHLIPKSQDIRLPLNMDIIRVPLGRQKCCNKINYFQNANAVIRSNHRTVVQPSLPNYVRPLQSTITNQVPEIENLKQIFSALGNIPTENALNNSNMSTLDLMSYLEQNHSLMNGVPLANQSLAYCFPLSLAGCSSGIRHNFNQIHRQNVSTQTARLELLNQYFCRKSKPVHSVSAGRARPMHFKRSLDHAFGSNFLEKKSSSGPNKKVRDAYEGCFSRISTANQFHKESNPIYTCSAEITKSHKLAFPSRTSSIYHHLFTELASKSQGSLMKPLGSSPHRVVCLTPPTEIQKKQSVFNGVNEISINHAPTSRPRSSSANAAEGYESLAAVVTSNPNNVKKLITPTVDLTHPLTSPFLANQISTGHKDPFYSIPRKNIFPIFSRSSKPHPQNLQGQTFCFSNKNGINKAADFPNPQKFNQSKKFLLPFSSHLHFSGWNMTGVGMNETPFLSRVQDNNGTLDLSLSKKRKTSNAKHIGEALKVDISRNWKAASNVALASSKKFSRIDKCADHNIVTNANAVSSCLSITKLSTCKQIQSSHFKGIVNSVENDTNPSNECPNVIDFRKSLPVTGFKLSELQNLIVSAIASTCSGNVGISVNTSVKPSNLLATEEEGDALIENILTKSAVDLKYSEALCLSSKGFHDASNDMISPEIVIAGSQDTKTSGLSGKQGESSTCSDSPCIISLTNNTESYNDMNDSSESTGCEQAVHCLFKEKMLCNSKIIGPDVEGDFHENNIPVSQEGTLIFKENDGTAPEDLVAEKGLEKVDFVEVIKQISSDNQKSSEYTCEAEKKPDVSFLPENDAAKEMNVLDSAQTKNMHLHDVAIGNKTFPDELKSSDNSCVSICSTHATKSSNADADMNDIGKIAFISDIQMVSSPITRTSKENFLDDIQSDPANILESSVQKDILMLERDSNENEAVGCHIRLHMECQIEDVLDSNEVQEGINNCDSPKKTLLMLPHECFENGY